MGYVWSVIHQNNTGGTRLDDMPGNLWVEHPEGANAIAYVDALNIFPDSLRYAWFCPCCGPRWEDWTMEDGKGPNKGYTYDFLGVKGMNCWILYADGTLEKDVDRETLPD